MMENHHDYGDRPPSFQAALQIKHSGMDDDEDITANVHFTFMAVPSAGSPQFSSG